MGLCDTMLLNGVVEGFYGFWVESSSPTPFPGSAFHPTPHRIFSCIALAISFSRDTLLELGMTLVCLSGGKSLRDPSAFQLLDEWVAHSLWPRPERPPSTCWEQWRPPLRPSAEHEHRRPQQDSGGGVRTSSTLANEAASPPIPARPLTPRSVVPYALADNSGSGLRPAPGGPQRGIFCIRLNSARTVTVEMASRADVGLDGTAQPGVVPVGRLEGVRCEPPSPDPGLPEE